jgi:amidase
MLNWISKKLARPWQEIAAEQQKIRDSAIPKEWLLKTLPSKTVVNVMKVPYECGIMTETELSLTEKDATELIEMMATGKLKSYDLTLAFCKRAAIAQQLLNCLTQVFFEEALARAAELDKIFQDTGKPVGPYHGLPFSIKDQFNIKDKVSSAGYIAWVDNVAKEDAPVVKILRDSGVVFFCKTNNPQTLMHLETNSNVHGRSLNPFNRNLTPGGSSGGEGALVGFRGSPIGLAADGGGSIRSPAANNGLYGMKATSNRIPVAGCTLPMSGCNTFPVVVGPVCRSLRDNEYFLKTIIDAEPWKTEHEIVPIPWRDIQLPERITIGIFADDDVVRPHPPVLAAVELVKKRLAALPCVNVVDWKPWNHGEGYDIIRELYFEDGGADNYNLMAASGEPPLVLSDWVMKESHTKKRTIEESWELNVKRDNFRSES